MTETRSALGSTPGHIDLSPGAAANEDARTMVLVVYGLYLAGFITGGLTTLIGVVVAYMARGGAPAWARSHLDFLVRTFWLTLLGFGALGALALVSSPLIIVLVGFVTLLLAGVLSFGLMVWYGVRCAVGFYKALSSTAYPNPAGWLL